MNEDITNGEIHKLIPRIMAEVGPIGKNRRNTGQNYNFRGIDDIYEALQPLLSKHGVYYVPQVTRVTRETHESKNGSVLLYTLLEINYEFYAPDGSSTIAAVVGEGMDSGDKSANKAMSAALKNACLQIFCIPTTEPKDSEYENHELVSKGKDVKAPSNTVPAAKKAKKTPDEMLADSPMISSKLEEDIRSVIIESNWSEDRVKDYLKTIGLKRLKELKLGQANAFYLRIKETKFPKEDNTEDFDKYMEKNNGSRNSSKEEK